MNARKPVVLIVEDDPDVAETYRLLLGDEYDTRLAGTGEAALAALQDVDCVLLDRLMPRMSGDEVLAEIRRRDLDLSVALVSADDPSVDPIEASYDDYLQKPPSRAELRATVSGLLQPA